MEVQSALDSVDTCSKAVVVCVLLDYLVVHVGQVAPHAGDRDFQVREPGFDPAESFAVVRLGSTDGSQVIENETLNIVGRFNFSLGSAARPNRPLQIRRALLAFTGRFAQSTGTRTGSGIRVRHLTPCNPASTNGCKRRR